MIRQLLVFARKGDVSMKTVPFVPFIKETLKLLAPSVPENIVLHQQVVDHPMQVYGNAIQLHQVLMNLIYNARDALSDSGEPAITIRLDLFEPDDAFLRRHAYFKAGSYAHLSVADNGCGMSVEQMTHLFEPFYTTKEEGKGTGLGLAMVFGAVKTHQGYIDVESEPGKGSHFHIYLPLQNEEQLTTVPQPVANIIMGNGEVILIVDDSDEVRSSSRTVLESMNYSVIEAADGMEAVDIFAAGQHDIALVLIDLVMPRLGGLEAVARIRAICPDVKVIYSTGYDKDEVLKGASDADALVVLSKPCHIDTLSRTIRDMLDA